MAIKGFDTAEQLFVVADVDQDLEEISESQILMSNIESPRSHIYRSSS